MPQKNHSITDTTIVRRLYKFFRQNKIEYVKEEGFFRLGSAVCKICNQEMHVYFPQFSKHYAGTIWLKLDFDDCDSLYHRFARKHNMLIKSFPLIHIRPVPDLLIKSSKQVKHETHKQQAAIAGFNRDQEAIAV